MIGNIPIIPSLEQGLRLLEQKTPQLSEFLAELNKIPSGMSNRHRVQELFQSVGDEILNAASSVTFLASRYALGDFTIEQLTTGLRELEYTPKMINAFVSGIRNLSERTRRTLKTRGVILGAKRVSPKWQSFGSSIEFKPVWAGKGERALVPFVTIRMTFQARGREPRDFVFELSALELMNLRSILASVFQSLKRETARLSEKTRDLTVSLEAVESMYPVNDNVQQSS